jgi:DNA (cytosine-5)-methyltransferase 1
MGPQRHDVALRTLSLCAGVGGLDLGVHIARPDARCVAFVEREASAAASLVASMEAGRLYPAPIWSDLRSFDAGAWRGAVDCVLSGDPCQGNSVAGKRLGEADDRWLLDRAIDVFDGSGAHTFFRENVVGNIVGQLAVAIPALERLGCRIAVGIFSAAEAGASHRRERLFILAHRSHVGHERSGVAWGRGAGPADGSVALDYALRGRHWHSDEALRAGRDGVVDAGGHVAHAHDGRRWPEGNCGVASDDVDAASGAMEHATRVGWGEGRSEHGVWGGRDPAADAGRALADANGRIVGHGHVQRGGQQRLQSESRSTGQGRARLRHDRPFAPGPSDPIWREIIRDAPSLEPAVCRMAHGVAGRIERLRHCGNGVVPLAAALAWVRLHGLLAGDAAGGAVCAADDRAARAIDAAVSLAA